MLNKRYIKVNENSFERPIKNKKFKDQALQSSDAQTNTDESFEEVKKFPLDLEINIEDKILKDLDQDMLSRYYSRLKNVFQDAS